MKPDEQQNFIDEQQNLVMGPYVLHPSKRKAQGVWPQVKEETNDRIVINVGGTCFETSRQTLCLDSNSMLTALVARHHSNNSTLWIDRDAARFRDVLNYLRNGTVWLNDIPSLRGIQEEANFFGLGGLKSLCEDLILEIEAREEEKSKRSYDQLRDAFQDVLENLDFPAVGSFRGQVLGATTGMARRCEPIFETNADF